MFEKKEGPISEDISPAEAAKLEAMEEEIKHGEHKLEHVQHKEAELEAEQEERVTIYQRFRNLFQREHKLEQEYEEVEEMKAEAKAADPGVTEDFRTMAQIQVRWLERLPTRIKEEFKESEDYAKLKDILQRRGVSKK